MTNILHNLYHTFFFKRVSDSSHTFVRTFPKFYHDSIIGKIKIVWPLGLRGGGPAYILVLN